MLYVGSKTVDRMCDDPLVSAPVARSARTSYLCVNAVLIRIQYHFSEYNVFMYSCITKLRF